MSAVQIRTTQNVEIKYPSASLSDRIFAFLIDGLIVGIYVIICFYLLFVTGIDDIDWLFVLLFIPVFFYHLISEIFFDGQSIGKKQMNIKVLKLDGTPPTLGAYLLRWMLRIIDISLINGGIAVLTILVSDRNQRLGDIAAGTTVVKLQSVKSVNSHELIRKLETEDDYMVSFPQVAQLSARQIQLIERAIEANKNNAISEPAKKLTAKIKSTLSIETDIPPIKFLYTVVKDYQYLNSAK